MLRKKDADKLRKIGYFVVGSNQHSACKVCTWTKKSLSGQGHCYKQKFYGIKSHRCLQMTPALPFCTHACEFCWRDTSITSPKWSGGVDEPKDILDACIRAQRILLAGFGGNEKTPKQMYGEARSPNQVAISLAGEPILFPKLAGLIAETRRLGMTSFLVTNGTQPGVLKNLNPLPTQLYVTLPAPSKEVYKKTCNPLIKEGWKKILETLELLPSLDTRKVVRLTLAKGLNFLNPAGYARLVKKATPHFLEVKAFMSVGFARQRISYERMPPHNEIKEFAKKIAGRLGWKIIDEKANSRVVLLAEEDYEWRKLS